MDVQDKQVDVPFVEIKAAKFKVAEFANLTFDIISKPFV